MTTDPDKQAEAPQKQPPRRFNPFLNEEDMFKVVLWAGGIVLVIMALVLLARAVF